MADAYWYEQLDTTPKPGRLMDIMRSTMTIAQRCLVLQPDQTVVIVTDTEVSPLVYHAMAAAVHAVGAVPTISMMRPLPHPNMEPPAAIAAAMRESDAIIAMVSRSISHTRAREIATQEYKRRYLLCPNVNEDMLMRGAATADFEAVKAITMATAKAVSRGKQVRVTSEHGTDLSFSIEGRPLRGYFGECLKPGDVQLFPGGEANTLPIQETIEGVLVVDSFMMEVGMLQTPITIEFRQGRAVEIRGGREADRLKRILEATKSPDSYRFGEFAIGTNYRARTMGNAFEDKEVYGTVHMALGSGVAWPKYYKPDYHAPIHVDGVLSSPTIEVDGEIVVTGRRILVAPEPPEE